MRKVIQAGNSYKMSRVDLSVLKTSPSSTQRGHNPEQTEAVFREQGQMDDSDAGEDASPKATWNDRGQGS